MDQVQRLLDKLRDKEFRERLGAWAKEIVELAQIPYRDEAGENDALVGDWESSVHVAIENILEPVYFFEEVLDDIRGLHIVTARELEDGFDIYFKANDPASGADGVCRDFDDVYNAFIDHMRFRLLAERRSTRFALCELTDIGDKDDGLSESILRIEDGIELHVEILSSELLDAGSLRRIVLPGTHTLVAQLIGRVSEAGMELLVEELTPIVRALFRSVLLIRGERVLPYRGSPKIKLGDLRDYLPFVTGCAKVLSPPQGKKDTTARRLSNAVRLLSEADRQTAMAIKLALSVAAIEALLGQKGSELTSLLATRVAVLLEPKRSLRSEAEALVKKLYGYRSKTLHGERLDSDETMVESARKLGACCLYAVWLRDDFCRRYEGRTDKPADLFDELQSRQYEEGLPDGLLPVPVARRLWAGT